MKHVYIANIFYIPQFYSIESMLHYAWLITTSKTINYLSTITKVDFFAWCWVIGITRAVYCRSRSVSLLAHQERKYYIISYTRDWTWRGWRQNKMNGSILQELQRYILFPSWGIITIHQDSAWLLMGISQLMMLLLTLYQGKARRHPRGIERKKELYRHKT